MEQKNSWGGIVVLVAVIAIVVFGLYATWQAVKPASKPAPPVIRVGQIVSIAPGASSDQGKLWPVSGKVLAVSGQKMTLRLKTGQIVSASLPQ